MELNSFFTEEEKQKINATITSAEIKTSAEIIPVLTDTSGSYDRAEDIVGLLLAIIMVSVLWIFFQRPHFDAAWTVAENPPLTYNLPSLLLTIIISFLVGTFLAGKLWFLRNLFASRGLMKSCVQRGAYRAFYEHNLSQTKNATGVMIYISLFERMVYVLGDTKISEKFKDEDFNEVKEIILNKFKSKKPAEGLCEGIQKCGEKLANYFPIQEGDQNELPNHLILLEQKL